MEIRVRAARADAENGSQPSWVAVAGLAALIVTGLALKAELALRAPSGKVELLSGLDKPWAASREAAHGRDSRVPTPASRLASPDFPAAALAADRAPFKAAPSLFADSGAVGARHRARGFGARAAEAPWGHSARALRAPSSAGRAGAQAPRAAAWASAGPQALGRPAARPSGYFPSGPAPARQLARFEPGGPRRSFLPGRREPAPEFEDGAARPQADESRMEAIALIAATPGLSQPLGGTGMALPGSPGDAGSSSVGDGSGGGSAGGAFDDRDGRLSVGASSGGGQDAADAGPSASVGPDAGGGPAPTSGGWKEGPKPLSAAAQSREASFAEAGALRRSGLPGAGMASTTEAADEYFITQWGPSPYNAGGAPYGYNDCGPASVVMALASLGLIERPDPREAATAIDAVRDAALGYDTTYSQAMGFGSLQQALEYYGARTQTIYAQALDAVEAAVERDNPLIIGGNPWEAWGQGERAAGNYLNSRDPGGHFITVLGKTGDGRYIVGDPLVKGGTIAVTGDQLAVFYGEGFGVMEISRVVVAQWSQAAR